jgi:hypothetical protein
VVTDINYQPLEIKYNVYDTISTETLRLTSAPMQVKVEGVPTNPVSSLADQGWQFSPLPGGGGSLKVTHIGGNNIDIILYPTAVNNVAQNTAKLEIYPNPASGSVNVSYMVTRAQSVKIEVSDMTGQKVREINTTAHSSENLEKINVSDLRSGIYTVRLTTQDGSEMVRKLILAN